MPHAVKRTLLLLQLAHLAQRVHVLMSRQALGVCFFFFYIIPDGFKQIIFRNIFQGVLRAILDV